VWFAPVLRDYRKNRVGDLNAPVDRGAPQRAATQCRLRVLLAERKRQ